ncbi:5-hydroxytryptamine receptor 3B isoform X2 [Monodelphis domestica]|uniref:5-hydroxytryptamine receptor 3B isoform X2 n=1 Tax=Monodelphis domestica TaxID=13616 RepID=UPI0024E1C36C|nr:5-hydroxytryptamine receptor 3B isoform X2 [Monodelphis domestica]
MDVEKSPDLPYVYVNSSGTIKNNKPIQVVSACSLETYAFPFDTQNCSLTFKSILHTVTDLDLAFLRSTEDIEKDKALFMNDGEWELLSVPSTYHVMHNEAGDFAQIQFHVIIRRRPLVYVVNLLIPSIFLMVVDLGSFYLPPNCRSRITFKTSILVGYTVFKVNMLDEVPRSAMSTPLIDVPHCQDHQTQGEVLKDALVQLQSISSCVQALDQTAQQEASWVAILYRFDKLLFRGYLLVLGVYTITLCSLWGIWSSLKTTVRPSS